MKRVLVIEPDTFLAQVIRMVLASKGHQAEIVPDGSSALQLYVPGRYKLVTMAFYIGSIHCYQIARALKEQCPSLPIVLISSTDGPDSEDREAGLFDARIAKPFHNQDLFDTVDRLCPVPRGNSGG